MSKVLDVAKFLKINYTFHKDGFSALQREQIMIPGYKDIF